MSNKDQLPDGEFRKNADRDDKGPNAPAPAPRGPNLKPGGSFPAATEVVDDDQPAPSNETVRQTETEQHDGQRDRIRNRIEKSQ